MPNRLIGPREKVKRAKHHIEQFEIAHRTFFDEHPYRIGTKHDPKTGNLIYYLTSVRSVPLHLPAIAGDAIQNLRSALDHLAQQLVIVGTGQPGPFYSVYFPIFDSASEYEAKKGAQIKGMDKTAIDALDAAAPYKGGNDTLWRISKLNKIDKHRLLVTVVGRFRSFDLGGYGFRQMKREIAKTDPVRASQIPVLSAFFGSEEKICPVELGTVLFDAGPDAEVDNELQFLFDVAFSEPKISECEPVIETLHHMTDVVDGLLTGFRGLL